MWRQTCVTLALLLCVNASPSDDCGRPDPSLNPRIKGGADAKEGAWPWMVSLNYKKSNEHFCGGSLINSQWVLTAAHCVIDVEESDLLVYLGKLTQQGDNANEITRDVRNIITHDDYNDETDEHDIALLHLSSAVTFNKHIQPVCLADTNSNFPPGTKIWITGWGDIDNKVIHGHTGTTTVDIPLPAPGTLQEVSIEVYSNDDCINQCHASHVTKNMICVGTSEGGKGSWMGDSGGPMVSKQCSQWVQAAVISHGYGCALAGSPDIYTRVSEYKQWIESTVGKDLLGFIRFDPPDPCSPASRTSTSCQGRCNEKSSTLNYCNCNSVCKENCCEDFKKRC